MKNDNVKRGVENVLLAFCVFFLVVSFVYSINNLGLPKRVNVFFGFSFFFFLTPYLLMRLYSVKRVAKKVEAVPRFFKDVVENVNSGMTLINSIYSCLDNEYDVLNQDVKKLCNRLKWGISLEEAFVKFAKDIGDRELKKDMILIIKSRSLGGHTEKMLDEIAVKIDSEISRKKQIRNYLSGNTITGYISFAIFLFIIVITFNSIFASLTDIDSSSEGEIVNRANFLKIQEFKSLLTILSYEMSVLSGALFGFMVEGNLVSGTHHVIFLVTMTFFTFLFFV